MLTNYLISTQTLQSIFALIGVSGTPVQHTLHVSFCPWPFAGFISPASI